MNITKNQLFIGLLSFLLWFLPLLGTVSYIYHIEVNSFRKELSSEELLSVHVGKEVIIKDLEAISADVLMLAKQTEFYELPSAPSQSDFAGLNREFLLLSQIKQHYDQVRFIDHNGQEVIRVNLKNGLSTIVSPEQLQNKANRYYFKDAFELAEGEIFVSPFDLNIEHGEIEKPFKPMLRFASPVFDKKGIKRGIVILNYLGSKLITDFKEATTHKNTDSMLLNNKGFWLYSIDSSNEWGFMLNNNRRFENLYPSAWQYIDDNDVGQVFNKEGMFTFDTLYPLTDGLLSSAGNHQHSHIDGQIPANELSQLRKEKEYYWKIVSHVSNEKIVIAAQETRSRQLYIFLPIFILLLFAQLWIFYAYLQKTKKDRLLNQVLKHSLNEIYILDSHTFYFKNVNQGAQKNIGYSMDELTTMTPLDFVENLTNEQLDKLVAPLINGEQQKIIFEQIHRRKDGSVYPVEIHLQFMGDNENLFVAVVLDISERKKADEKINQFAHMVSNTSDLMALVDKDYIFLSVNEAYLKKINKSAEQIVGHNVIEIMGDDFFKTICQPNAQKCFKGQTINFECRIDLFEQKNRLMSVVYSPYYDEDKIIQGFVLSSRDITEYEVLRSSKLESIGLLAGGIAHDFNNIMTGLFGNLYLAKMKLPDGHAASKYIDLSEQAMERARSLTSQLLTFSKGGEPIVEKESISEIINDLVTLHFSGCNVKAVIVLQDNLWSIDVDRGQISQAIGAILMNAIQAMPKGGNFYVKGENINDINLNILPAAKGKFVKLSFRDEGAGINPEDIEKIFDPYFSTKPTSSGLGLSATKSIIAKHGGYIIVDSKVTVGTTFDIYLPVTNAQEEILSTESKSSSSFGNILIMDDDEMIRVLSVELLESFGHKVGTSIDGMDALKKYAQAMENRKPFDIVIMDLTIPGGMGGSEAVRKLLEIDPQAKVIVSSGYSTDSAMANYAEHGFSARLLKPFQMEELQEVISSLLNS